MSTAKSLGNLKGKEPPARTPRKGFVSVDWITTSAKAQIRVGGT